MPDSVFTIPVNVPGRAYLIEIGPGLLRGLGQRLRDLTTTPRATVISDETVSSLYGDGLGESLKSAGIEYAMMTVPPGDASKSLAVAAELYDALAETAHQRADPIIALGGGMVGDLAGFVAATWMRGVPIVQCPTTLEAMIDASVGGKTAVNLPAGKNLVGAIHQPALVCADTHTLATLPDRDFRAGLAESVKHAVIADESLLNWQEQHAPAIVSREPGTLQELIRRNCQIKAAAVAGDERETAAEGVGRAALNFGHTIGHALEAESRYELRHGEAVALGMVAEMELAVRLCQWGQDNQERVELLLEQFGLPLRAARPLDMTCVIGRLEHDKKASGKSVRFVLPGPGGTMQWVAGASQADIAASLRRLMDKPPAA